MPGENSEACCDRVFTLRLRRLRPPEETVFKIAGLPRKDKTFRFLAAELVIDESTPKIADCTATGRPYNRHRTDTGNAPSR